MNPLRNLFGGSGNVMMQALAAMRRGEDPTAFLRRIAQSNPQLQGIDFNNLQGAAQDLCRKKNVNIDEAVGKIQGFMKQ